MEKIHKQQKKQASVHGEGLYILANTAKIHPCAMIGSLSGVMRLRVHLHVSLKLSPSYNLE